MPRDRYDLVCLATAEVFHDVKPIFMRLLPPADVMHDIDAAPLGEAEAMLPAAVAWVRQHRQQPVATSAFLELLPAT